MENNLHSTKEKSTYVMMALNLAHKKLLVVGGGPVAFKRFIQWTGRKAEIHVVAPEFCMGFEELSNFQFEGVCLHKRSFKDQDLEGVWMVYIATRDEELNEHIEGLCRQKGILWGRGDLSTSEVQSVAMIERGFVQIGISTSGKAPTVVMQIKEKIEEVLDLEDIEARIDLMQKLKLRLKSEEPDQAQRALLLRKAAKMSLEELERWMNMTSLLEFDKILP